MAVTPTTDIGWFDYLSKLDAMVDYDYAKTVSIDDLSALWRTAKWLMSQEGQSKPTDTPIFYLWDGALGDRIYTINGAHTTGDLTLTLDSTAGLTASMILRAQSSATGTGNYYRIASVDSATVVTVVRAIGTTGLADNQELQLVGTSKAENAAAGLPDSYVYPEAITNRVQHIERAVEWTEWELSTKLRAESAIAQKHRFLRGEYEKDVDAALLASAIAVDTTNRFQLTNGIISLILASSATTKQNAGGDEVTYEDFTSVIAGMMQYATTEDLIGLCGTSGIRGFSELGASGATYRSSPKDNIYGFSGDTVKVANFKVHLVFERMFKELGGYLNNYIAVVSGPDWQVRHLGPKFRWRKNYKDVESSNVIRSSMDSSIGIGGNHVKRNALIYNLAAA